LWLQFFSLQAAAFKGTQRNFSHMVAHGKMCCDGGRVIDTELTGCCLLLPALQIVLYQALTGRLCCVLGSHEGMVYSISWARDDSCIITASADYTSKVWHLPLLPCPANAAAAGTASLITSSINSSSGVTCSVLQHKCFVYAAELHPVQQPLLLAVTGGYDGMVRVWSAADGQQLSFLQVSCSPINCLAFNQLGSRMFTGDAAGVLAELSVDVTPLSSSSSGSSSGLVNAGAAAAAWAAATAASGSDTPVRRQQQQSMLLSLRPSTPVGQAAAAAAAAVAETVSPVAAVLRHGSPASQLLAGEPGSLHV
jgi:WD40 repeat protein